MIECLDDLLLTWRSDAAQQFSPESWESHQALQIANKIMDVFQPGSQESIVNCRKLAQDFLGSRIGSEAVYETDTSPIVYGIGHCHIGELHDCALEPQVTEYCSRHMLALALG